MRRFSKLLLCQLCHGFGLDVVCAKCCISICVLSGVTNKDCLAVMFMNYGGLSWAFVIAAVSLSQCPTLVALWHCV